MVRTAESSSTADTAIGNFIPLDPDSEEVYSYIRCHPVTNQSILVVLNFAKGKDGMGVEVIFDATYHGVNMTEAKLLISNVEKEEESNKSGAINLAKWEGRVYLLKPNRYTVNLA